MRKQQWTRNGRSRKIASMSSDQSKEQKRGHPGGTEKAKKDHFATLMDICHLKNAELEPKFQKYKGWFALGGDTAKNDSGSYAVFTCISNDSRKSKTDVVARQAGDAVSAKTRVKMKDAPKMLKIPKSERPDIWTRLPRHKWPKSRSNMEDPVVPLERNLYGHPLAGLLWERQFETVLLGLGWNNVPNWECLFVNRKQGLFLS